MTEPTVARPDIDPVLKMLLDTFPVTFTAADGVEVARARLRQLKTPPELLPELRIEERTVGYDGLTDIPVRVYWPPVVRDNLPVVVYYHGGGWSLGGLDTHDPVARAHAVGAQAIVVSVPACPGTSLPGRDRRQLGGIALGRRKRRRTGR